MSDNKRELQLVLIGSIKSFIDDLYLTKDQFESVELADDCRVIKNKLSVIKHRLNAIIRDIKDC